MESSQLQLMALPVGTQIVSLLSNILSPGNTDLESLHPVSVFRNGAEIRVFTTNDETTLEYDDRVLLTYTPSVAGLILGVEGAGEYVRNTAIIRIIDNDRKFHCTTILQVYNPISFCAGLQINVEESDYSITEGVSVLSDNITLTFRTNQNPFSVILTPVTIGTAESMGLGSFINFDNIARTFRATAGLNFKYCGLNSLFLSIR